MKDGKQPGRTAHAQNYIDADRRLPPYYDPAFRLVRNGNGSCVLNRSTVGPLLDL